MARRKRQPDNVPRPRSWRFPLLGGLGLLTLVGVMVALSWKSEPHDNALDEADDSPAATVRIEGGTFTMGNDQPGPGGPDESPAHEVTLDGFWIEKTEVTNGRF